MEAWEPQAHVAINFWKERKLNIIYIYNKKIIILIV